MMSGLLLPFDKEELTTNVIDLDSFEFIWVIKDPIDGVIDSLTDFDDIDDFEKLLLKEKAFLENL